MAEDLKRGRGRPRGTGKPEDQTALHQIAALLVEQPSLKPTTAIRQLIGTRNQSDTRRLQVKWKAEGSVLLADARGRQEEKRRVKAATLPGRALHPVWAALGSKPSSTMQAVMDVMRRQREMQVAIDAMKPWNDKVQAAIDAMKPWNDKVQAAIDATKAWNDVQAAIDATKPWNDAQAAVGLKPSSALQATMDAVMRRHREMQVAIDAMKPWREMQAAIDALKGPRF